MTLHITELPATAVDSTPGAGLGTLKTEHGNLPLQGLAITTHVTELVARTEITQRFHNPHPDVIEAEYIFPLPDRAAVTAMTVRLADREVTASLRERGRARADYAAAIKQGKRAAIAEAERADVFTMRVGNIAPDESATVTLTLVGPLALEDGKATVRIPLVVAPRYIPGRPLDGPTAGGGHAPDTEEVPDASRITPPILLPGFPNPVDLAIDVTIDPGSLPLRGIASSLHAVEVESDGDRRRVRINPGERVNRDFILRLDYGEENVSTSLVTAEGDTCGEGTFQLTLVPPRRTAPARPRDVVIVLDRSGSMQGWKMVAARRAAARIVDTLSDTDRFAVRCFDHEMTGPSGLEGLVAGTDRNRFTAVEHLSRIEARGGTEMGPPLRAACDLLAEDGGRDRVVVLVTDGQVGNEDKILAELADRAAGIRVHAMGIDRAVNAGFLHRLALMGRGRCELVESHDRLDEASVSIHRRIVAPVVTDIDISADEGTVVEGSLAPSRARDLFTGVPLVLYGRYRDGAPRLRLTGTDGSGRPWRAEATPIPADDGVAVAAMWARARLRDLEDSYAATRRRQDLPGLEEEIVAVSLANQVMSRFTAFVAVDSETVDEKGAPRTIVQPVEYPQGWDVPVLPDAPGAMRPMAMGVPAGTPTRNVMGVAARGRMQPGGMLGRPVVQRPPRKRTLPRQAVRDALVAELGLLGELTALDERTQRMRLSDLATRLDPVLSGLSTEDAAILGDLVARLRSLVDRLGRCEGPRSPVGEDLTVLRDDVESALRVAIDVLAAPNNVDSPSPEPDSKPTKDTAARRDSGFWKRT